MLESPKEKLVLNIVIDFEEVLILRIVKGIFKNGGMVEIWWKIIRLWIVIFRMDQLVSLANGVSFSLSDFLVLLNQIKKNGFEDEVCS